MSSSNPSAILLVNLLAIQEAADLGLDLILSGLGL